LILGGLGLVGRHLVRYLVNNGLTSKIRVVDKTMVAMARLGADFEAAFSKVECIQANLISAEGAEKAFQDSSAFSIVINLAGETKFSQEQTVYNDGITKLSVNVAQAALKYKTEKFIEISSSEVYEPSTKPSNEQAAVKPWTGIGRAKAAAEEQLKALKGLPLIVVRPAIVYGPGDTRGLAPRLCIAAVYKHTGAKMEFPQWFEETKINTVHVTDCAKAIWHIAANGTVGSVYNLADKNDTDQKKLNGILEKIFGIKIGHMGTITSEAIKLMSTENILEEVNGELIPTWVKMSKEAKLDYTPLSPCLDADSLQNKSLCIDGSGIEKTGFKYEHPNVTEELLKEQLKHATDNGWFPPKLF